MMATFLQADAALGWYQNFHADAISGSKASATVEAPTVLCEIGGRHQRAHRELSNLYFRCASPDGSLLAFERTLKGKQALVIVNAPEFSPMFEIAVPEEPVGLLTEVTFSSDGRNVIYNRDGSYFAIFDLETREIANSWHVGAIGLMTPPFGRHKAKLEMQENKWHWNMIFGTEGGLAISRNLELIVGGDRSLWSVDPKTGAKSILFEFPEGEWVHRVSVSPDGRRAAFFVREAIDAGRIMLWDVAKGIEPELLSSYESDQGETVDAADMRLSPDGRWLTLRTNENDMQLWDLGHRERVFTARLEDNGLWFFGRAARFADDGQRLVFTECLDNDGGRKSLRVFDLRRREIVQTIRPPETAQKEWTHWVPSPDGRRLAASDGSTLRVFDVDSDAATLQVDAGDVANLAFVRRTAANADNANGHDLLMYHSASFQALDTASAKQLVEQDKFNSVQWMQFSGNRLVIGHGGILGEYQLPSGELVREFRSEFKWGYQAIRGSVAALDCNRTLRRTFVADCLTGAELVALDQQDVPVIPADRFMATPDGNAIALSNFMYYEPDGIATTRFDGVRIWDGRSGRLLRDLPEDCVSGGRFSADGTQWICQRRLPTHHNTVRWIDIQTGNESRTFLLPDSKSHDVVQISSDNRLVVTSDNEPFAEAYDRRACVWDVVTQTLLLEIRPKDGGTVSFFGDRGCSISPDCHWLALRDPKGGVSFWSIPKRRRLYGIEIPDANSIRMEFSPDSKLFACCNTNDNVVRVIQMPAID